MKILAIDPSLTSTGVCKPDGTCKTIRSKVKGWERIEQINDRVAGWIIPPDLVVIEECVVGGRSGAPGVNLEVIWLHGVLRLTMVRMGIPYVDIHPSRRMKYACGDQKERGKDAVLLRAERAGARAENNDEADAWWMWRMAVDAYSQVVSTSYGDVVDIAPIDLPLYRLEVLASIDWPEVNGCKPQWEMPKKPKKVKVSA